MNVDGKDSSVSLHQAKTVSKNRMGIRIEEVPDLKLKEIKKAFAKFYSL